jgi:hypothetical protein
MADKTFIEPIDDSTDYPWMAGIQVLQRDSGRYLLVEPDLGTYRCYDPDRDVLGGLCGLEFIERGGDMRLVYVDEAALASRGRTSVRERPQ